MDTCLYRAKHLAKTYGVCNSSVDALQNATFSIERGTFVAMTGPSGSGKSTLLGLMGLISHPTGGTLFFQDQNVETMRPKELASFRNAEIGFVFQSFHLIDRTTALENVELPMIYANIDASTRKERALSALEQVGLGDRVNYYANQLSGGEQQRVAIARAIVNNPSVVLADEPTGALDSATGKDVMNLLRTLNDEGTTVIVVTHNLELVVEVDQYIRLSDGRIV